MSTLVKVMRNERGGFRLVPLKDATTEPIEVHDGDELALSDEPRTFVNDSLGVRLISPSDPCDTRPLEEDRVSDDKSRPIKKKDPVEDHSPTEPVAEEATLEELSFSDRITHVVLGSAAEDILEIERLRRDLDVQVAHRQDEVACSLEQFQSDLNSFCDSFGRTFHDTEEQSAVEQARAFAKNLNARLLTLGYRLMDPESGRPAALKAFPLKNSPASVYFSLRYSAKIHGEKAQTTAEDAIPRLFLSPI